MGIGKIFTGLAIIVGWLVIDYGVIQNDNVMSNLISSQQQRAAIVSTFGALQSVIWIIVMLIGFGIILWGLKE